MKQIKFSGMAGMTLLFIAGMMLTITACQTKDKYPDKYGLALYTVRDAMKSDPAGTLREVADMGYSYVEAAGYNLDEGTLYGMAPEEFKKMVDDAGLTLVSSHVGVESVLDSTGSFDPDRAAKMVDDHARAGVKYLVNAHISDKYRSSVQGYKTIADDLNKLGELTKAKGFGVLYHNHSFEFDTLGTTTGYDILMENMDPSLANFQLDCYWSERAGHDPVKMINSHPGRFKSLHLKDMNPSDQSFAEIGQGDMDYKSIIAAGYKSGVEYFLVEQDRSKRDPMESARMSMAYLDKLDAGQ